MRLQKALAAAMSSGVISAAASSWQCTFYVTKRF
jgi:hypothetical protein